MPGREIFLSWFRSLILLRLRALFEPHDKPLAALRPGQRDNPLLHWTRHAVRAEDTDGFADRIREGREATQTRPVDPDAASTIPLRRILRESHQ